MRKYKVFMNLEKEEQWLSDLAQQGIRLEKKTWLGYKFRRDLPEAATIKMDYRTFKQASDFEDYRALFEDSGWEHISGTKNSGFQYFRKADKEGSKEIFSDVDSKAIRYKRLSDLWALLACVYAIVMFSLIRSESIDPGAILNPKLLYFTPGLWELEGEAFWRSFLFETPFAVFRGLMWLFLPVVVIAALYCAFKLKNQYNRMKEDDLRI